MIIYCFTYLVLGLCLWIVIEDVEQDPVWWPMYCLLLWPLHILLIIATAFNDIYAFLDSNGGDDDD